MVIRSTPYIDAQAGQGVTVLAFISQPDDIAKLKIALDTEGHVFELTEEEQQQQNSGSEASSNRETGANILKLVAEATEPVSVINSIKFIADTLFCEWAYVVDLDKETFEVYKGEWDKYSGQSRFGAAEDVKESAAGPIDIASWRLSELPDEAAFLQACTVSDDEEGSNNGADDNAEVAANV